MPSRSFDKLGWTIVAVILVGDGIRLAVAGQLWSRVRVSATPVSEGWHIVLLGIIEALIGVYVGWRLLRKND